MTEQGNEVRVEVLEGSAVAAPDQPEHSIYSVATEVGAADHNWVPRIVHGGKMPAADELPFLHGAEVAA